MLRPSAVAAVVALGVVSSFGVSYLPARGPQPAAAPPRTAADRAEEDPEAVAVRLLQQLGSVDAYDSERRSAVVDASVDPELARSLTTGLALAGRAIGLDERGRSEDGSLVARLVPAGSRVLERDADRAVIAVWTVGLLGVAGPTSPHPVVATWSTDTVTLRRDSGRWVVTALNHQDGPAPVGGAQVPAAPTELLRHLREHQEPR